MRNLRRWWSLSWPDRGLLAMTCLRKALVLGRLLSRQGIAADLCICVRREAGRLMAHAWLLPFYYLRRLAEGAWAGLAALRHRRPAAR